MQEERKTKGYRLQESDTLRRRVCGLEQSAEGWSGPFDATEEVYDPNVGIPLFITASPLFDENGELTAVVHAATDITKRKKAREVLRAVGSRKNVVGGRGRKQ